MTKVSIIVPVYNVEKYLKKCLDSLVNQTFKDYEIIVVNDGSTDDSENIIMKYQSEYSKLIKYIKKQNGGLSDARNKGIKTAEGKYIMFVDSDDYITQDMVEKLYSAIIKEDSDMAICNYIRVNFKGENIKNYNYNFGTTNVFDNPKILLNKPAAWNKIYKKTLFDNMMYDKGKYYEDIRLTTKLYLKCNKIAFIDDFCYYYIERANSIMQDKNIDRNFEIVDALKSIIDFYKKEAKYDIFKEEIEFIMIDNIIISTFVRIICCSKSYSKYLKDYLNFINQYFPNYKKNKYIKELDYKRKIVYFLNSKKLYGLTKILFKMKG